MADSGSSPPSAAAIPLPPSTRASSALRFNRFHTTALCSPTRAALITGRNHHAASFAGITERATRYDGYGCILPKRYGTVGEVHVGMDVGSPVDFTDPLLFAFSGDFERVVIAFK